MEVLPSSSLAGAILVALTLCACSAHDAFERSGRPPAGVAACDGGGDRCLRARTDCAWGSFACNPAIEDPLGQIRALPSRGRPLRADRAGLAGLSRTNHFQSIQRLAAPGVDRLVLSRSTARADETDFSLVGLGPAGRGDRVIRSFDTGTGYTHAGGGQLMGQVYAVPLERDAAGSAVLLYDLRRPLEPRVIGVVPHQVGGGRSRDDAGTASLAALADGRFLLIIGGRDAEVLDLYLSTTVDIEATGWRHLASWTAGEARTAIDDAEVGAYQELQLLAGRDGRLHLVGTHRSWTGVDWLDLFRLEVVERRAGARVTLTKTGRRRLDCTVDGVRHCDFDAGAGLYVDPAGRLAVYAVQHEADSASLVATTSWQGDSIRLMEFR
jgi:hypothetical protein